MAIKIVQRENVEDYFNIDNAGVVKPKTDGTSIRHNANDELEAILKHDVKLSGVTFNPATQELIFTIDDGSTNGVTLPPVSLASLVDVDTNTYASSAAFVPNADNTNAQLVITMSNGDDVIAPITPMLPLLVNLMDSRIKNAIGNNAVLDLQGNYLGHLVNGIYP